MSSAEPNKLHAEIQISALLIAEGHTEEAILRLERLCSAAPAYATSQVLLARAFEAEGRRAEALEAWHRAHFLVPGSPLVRRERRRLLEFKESAGQVVATAPPPPPIAGPAAEQVPPADYNTRTEEAAQIVATAESSIEKEQPTSTVHSPVSSSDEPAAATSDRIKEAPADEPQSSGTRELNDDMHGVFVDDLPVSDALGAGVRAEMWDDAPDVTPDVQEAAVSAPEFDSSKAEPLATSHDGKTAWWKRAADTSDEASSEDVDEGWAVVSEVEAPPTNHMVADAQIEAPNGSGRADSEEASLAEDLDSLIQQLEDAPRILPKVDASGREEALDDDAADDMVSETLARIYVAQGQYAEAALVYEKLAEQQPDSAEAFREKAADLRVRLSRSK